MKFLKGLGWLFVPYIMIFFRWRKLGKVGKTFATVWSVIALIIGISGAAGGGGSSQTPNAQTASAPPSTDQTTTTKTSSTATTKTTTAPAAKPQTTKPAPKPVQKPAAQAPAYTLTSNGVTYKGADVSNVRVAITGVETASSVGTDGMDQKADGKFVIIHLLVKNEQNDAITLTSSEFNILDSQGRKYSASTDASTYYSMQDQNEKDLFLNDLNPGVTTAAFVIYDVPADLNVATAKLQIQGGFTGDTTTTPLAVQKQ